ncbi:MAG: hypothetical protein AAGK14_11575 [Verrucomicrobiota bacterium]
MGETVLNPVWRLDYVVLAFAALIVAGGAVAWMNARRCAWPSRTAATALRVLGIGGLAVIALNPGRWLAEPVETATEWAVLIDTSRSMNTEDVGDDRQQRLEKARELARRALDAAPNPDAVRLYAFDGDARELVEGDLETLIAEGDDTNITLAGQSVLARSRSRGKSLAGILLLTDGRQVSDEPPEAFALLARARQAPIFPLPLYGQETKRDLELSSDRRQYVGFPGQKVQVAAKLTATGLGRIMPEVELADDTGKVLERRKVALTGDGEQRLEFEPAAEAPGYREYTLRVAPWGGESDEANNFSAFGITTLAEPLRILFLEGSPSWDSKFLIQLLRRQPNFRVVSNYRLSSDRFFRIENDVADADEATANTFPANLEELSGYDIVIFGKGAEYFMTSERISMLKEFVRTQGGTVLFSRSKPYHGELPELAPLEAGRWGDLVNQEFTLSPTNLGVESGLFEPADSSFWEQLPPLEGAVKISHFKPFTETMATGLYARGGGEREFPVVVTRRYGQGMSLTVNADGLWKWDFFPQVTQHGVMYDRFWTQLIQWAAIYAEFLPGQKYSLHLSSYSAQPREPVRVRIERRGRAEAKLPPPSVEVRRGEELVTSLSSRPAPGHAQRWELILSLPEPGRYRVLLGGQEDEGDVAPSRGLVIEPPPTEASSAAGNTAFLRRLADISSGKLVTEADLDTLLSEGADAPPPEESGTAEWQPLWDQTWLLGFMLGCFTLEWVIRRRNGLM